MNSLRPSQTQILAYRQGKMGISAVPGSGKTYTLSLLAADLISRGALEEDQEVLVVTLVNSAVDNFSRRVSHFLKIQNLIPNLGYRVRTLHGLAHDIVRERPGLVGLANDFQIIDDRAADSIRNEAARLWLHTHPFHLDETFKTEVEEDRRDRIRRENLPEMVQEIASRFIRYAKDRQISPEELRRRLDGLPVPLQLAEMGSEIYADYQRSLAYRGAVDFDDLIRLALHALQSDPALLTRLRLQWPYILEDEAQDSSRLQEEILSTLAGPGGNWVRVGDPNQAIYETFTTANPRYLREFLEAPGVSPHHLPNSGRSSLSIIRLANYLVTWTLQDHPQEPVRDALQAAPLIVPSPPGDPQPNPDDDPAQVHLVLKALTPHEEIHAVVESLKRWLPEHPNATVAVLAPRNQRGFDLVDELRRKGLPFVDSLLASTASTRFSARTLSVLLAYLAEPQSARKLAEAYRIWRQGARDPLEKACTEKALTLLRKAPRPEEYLWPLPDRDWLANTGLEIDDPLVYEHLVEFRRLACRWQKSIRLPVDQVVLTMAQDLLSEPAELALSHKLALLLRQASQVNPSWRLPQLTEELDVIARNERRFIGFGQDDSGFDPDLHPGKVVVSTMHKAKGLEWDRVYLMSVNSYDFPSGNPSDQYMSEKWFVHNGLNLEAEAMAQLDALLSDDPYAWYEPGLASLQARLDYIRERLRLLYVGITRARKELVITWNTGRFGDQKAADPLIALSQWWNDNSSP